MTAIDTQSSTTGGQAAQSTQATFFGGSLNQASTALTPLSQQPFDREAALTIIEHEPTQAGRDDMEQWLAKFASYLETNRRLRPRTVDTYVKYCRILFRGTPQVRGWRGEMTAEHLKQFLAVEDERGLSAGTLRTQMFSLTAYYAYLNHIGVQCRRRLKTRP